MNLPRVHDFLASGLTDHTAETLFDGVRQLRGGECAVVEAAHSGKNVPRIRRWYDVIDLKGHPPLSEQDAADRFRELLTDAVRIRLRSDVPVGSCLSGGLDSSSIVCLMANMLDSANNGGTTRTISACYAEKCVDERPYMDAVIAQTRALPTYVYPSADDISGLTSDITWHQDEPFGSTSIVAQSCVFAKARRVGLTVMLDGQGADELLAGYHFGFPIYIASLIRCGRLPMALRTVYERSKFHGVAPLWEVLRSIVQLLPASVVCGVRASHRKFWCNDWLGSDLMRNANFAGAEAVALKGLDLPPVRDLSTMCLAQTYATNLQMLLHYEDRNSMAHSIEARVPFLDHRLVEFSLRLDDLHKTVGANTKRVLRTAMSGVLPDVVRDRQDKVGFATPEQIWFRGPLKTFVRDEIEATLRRYPDLFNCRGVRQFSDDMLEGRRGMDSALWRILNVGIWGERFKITY
jgi:asparagine synthase (glutamine-hydrolysing)